MNGRGGPTNVSSLPVGAGEFRETVWSALLGIVSGESRCGGDVTRSKPGMLRKARWWRGQRPLSHTRSCVRIDPDASPRIEFYDPPTFRLRVIQASDRLAERHARTY